MRILVTGGAGYIGSHACVELINSGYEVVIVDNFCNSSLESIKRIEKLTNTTIPFYELNIGVKVDIIRVFEEQQIDGVMHFAGLKSISDSITRPIDYYNNNVSNTIYLLEVMRQFNCKIFVFSSTASIYGDSKVQPISENFPLSPSNPYGRSKLVVENILKDILVSEDGWMIALLRYFNPIGAHASGIIGESSLQAPNNLMPLVLDVASGKQKKLKIFGDDYPTHDGTGVRDYIHVTDLAKAHVKVLQAIISGMNLIEVNIGTGRGYSVFDLIKTFELTSGIAIPYEIIPRRSGDVAICYADVSKAEKLLGWKAELGLRDMCIDAWRWQSMSPKANNSKAKP